MASRPVWLGSMLLLAAFFALASHGRALLAAPAAPGADRSGGDFLRVQESADDKRPPCLQELNRRVQSAFGWRFNVRTVEARDGNLVVTISFRNSEAASGLIALAPEAAAPVRLIDQETAREYPARTIAGIDPVLKKVERDDTALARFTFPFPSGAAEVRFMSTWVAPIMRGLGQKIRVEFPIALPAPGACGS